MSCWKIYIVKRQLENSRDKHRASRFAGLGALFFCKGKLFSIS
jgi:hypothetical protein